MALPGALFPQDAFPVSGAPRQDAEKGPPYFPTAGLAHQPWLYDGTLRLRPVPRSAMHTTKPAKCQLSVMPASKVITCYGAAANAPAIATLEPAGSVPSLALNQPATPATLAAGYLLNG